MKHVLLSKTLWFNILVGCAPVIADNMIGSSIIDTATQANILAVGNFILRLFTKTKVTV